MKRVGVLGSLLLLAALVLPAAGPAPGLPVGQVSVPTQEWCLKHPDNQRCKPKPTPTPTPVPTPTPTPTPVPTPTPTPVPTPTPTPIPTPTPTPTVTPTPTPTVTPTPTPTITPTPPPGCPPNLQTAINNTPTGGTLNVGGCSFHEAVTVPRAMTINGYGATIFGDSRSTWVTVNASDVTVAGFTMVGPVTNAQQTGAFKFSPGTARGMLKDCDLSGSTGGAAVALGSANQTTIQNCHLHDNKMEGLHLGRDGDSTHGHDNLLKNLDVYGNGDPAFAGFERGGMKATLQQNLIIDGGTWHNNVGPGIWWDIHNIGGAIRNAKVYSNDSAGIFYEISSGAIIENNATWENGWVEDPGTWWPWGANILLSSSGSVTVRNNISAWGSAGISVISQGRTDRMADAATGISVTGNTLANSPGRYSYAYAQDWAGPLFTDGNGGSLNKYWYAAAEGSGGRFAWTNQISTLSAFNATPAEEGGTYLTTAQKDSILSSAGVPTTSAH